MLAINFLKNNNKIGQVYYIMLHVFPAIFIYLITKFSALTIKEQRLFFQNSYYKKCPT